MPASTGAGGVPTSAPLGADGVPAARRPLRVVLLAPSLHPGGAERQMLILAAALPRESFEIRFLVLSELGPLAAEARALGVPVHVLGLRREACRRPGIGCLRDVARAIRAYRRLTRDVDIVDAWLVPAYTFAGAIRPIARVPVLLAGRRSGIDVRRTRTWYREIAGRLAMRHVDAVVANSRAAADQAVAVERIAARKVHVIRNAVVPVATAAAERQALREAWGFSGDDVVAGCVGTFKPGKGQDLLLEVASALRDRCPRLRFCFVGDGPLRATLEAEIRRRDLGGVVVLLTEERDARHLYGAFDLAVQASASEGLPNAVLEAASAGLGIVATAVGGTPEILTHERDGLLVPAADRDRLADAIEALALDPELRHRLGEAASDRAGAFSAGRLAGESGALYERLAGELSVPSSRRGRAERTSR